VYSNTVCNSVDLNRLIQEGRPAPRTKDRHQILHVNGLSVGVMFRARVRGVGSDDRGWRGGGQVFIRCRDSDLGVCLAFSAGLVVTRMSQV
jgi:hypothetical protein